MRRYFCFLAVVCLLAVSVTDAYAARHKGKKKKGPPQNSGSRLVSESDCFPVQVNIPVGKKKKRYTVQCLERTPGQLKQEDEGLMFTPYSVLVKKLKKQAARGKKSASAKLALYQRLDKAGKATCREPAFRSLDPYKGTFGVAEAHILCERFAFDCSPAEVQRLVGLGLDGAVNDLTTYAPNPYLDAYDVRYRCEEAINDDPDDDSECTIHNPNQFYSEGVRYALIYRLINGQGFFGKLFMFLHDERAAVSGRVLNGNNRFAQLVYFDKLWQAANSGDYRQYVIEYQKDELAHHNWLSGKANHYLPGVGGGNEDFGRELLELLTIGTVNLTKYPGEPNYGDITIVNSAMAVSGWDESCDDVPFNGESYRLCRTGFFDGFHAPGPKTLFGDIGHPEYQITVYDADQLVAALFQDHRTADSLADDLWHHFINSSPTSVDIAELSKIIREEDFNLVRTLRRVMKSQAVFAAQSQHTIIKDPVHLMIGFLRKTGIPSYEYRNYEEWLNNMGQLPTNPPTVFGWDAHKLAGEARVPDWRNVVNDILRRETNAQTLDDDDSEDTRRWKERINANPYSYYTHFIQGIEGAQNRSLALVQRLAEWFNIKLTDEQVGQLVQFLDYELECTRYDSQWHCLEEAPERDAFDPHPDNWADPDKRRHQEFKIKGLLSIFAQMPEFRTM